MYTKALAVAPGAGMLAMTGPLELGWLLVAGFTLVFAGLALLHILPHFRKAKN